jgi:competence protein ComEA
MRPGVYEVRPGGRVNDAVMAAGGPSAQADLEAINLAEKISDGTRVSVPFRLTEDASSSAGIDRQAGQSAVNPQPKPAPAGTANRVVVQGTTTPPQAAERAAKINVNSATADELRALPGIGEKLSLAIVQHREQNGPFDKPEDLLKVRGIGAKRFESIKDLVAVSN